MNQKQRFEALIMHLKNEGIIISNSDLADKLGYPATTLSNIKNGNIGISEKFLSRLKRIALDLNTDWLLTGEGEMLIADGKNVMQGNTGGINQQNVNGQNTATNVDSRFIEIFQEQTRQLSTAQQQITDLIQILKKQ